MAAGVIEFLQASASILQRQCLRDASFRLVEDLRTTVLVMRTYWQSKSGSARFGWILP
jgi:hypothetical protein